MDGLYRCASKPDQLISSEPNNFIQKLDEMKNTASTYNIETPDTVYYSYDLTHFDYFVGSYRGQTLLMANCTFEEIMDGGEVIIANAVLKAPTATQNKQ
jgi:hypothetical protein